MRILLVLPLAALIAGCGSSGSTETSSPPPAASSTTSTSPSSGSTPSGEAPTVKIKEFKFGEPVTIPAGGEVTWENEDAAPHNAVGDEFKTADLQKGDSDTVTFDKPGTYDYICTFHAYMKGSVVVE